MGDQISSVSGVSSAGDTSATGTDEATLNEAFQNALLQGEMFITQSLASDTIDALNDSSGDPDAVA